MPSWSNIKHLDRRHPSARGWRSTKIGSTVTLACAVATYLRTLFLPRHKLALQAAALRQQLAIFKRKQPRPKLDPLDRLFWIVLRRLWEGWSEALIVVRCRKLSFPGIAPDSGSSGGGGLGDVDGATEGEGGDSPVKSAHEGRRIPPGAPRIHGELRQLGFEISEPTVSRYLQKLDGGRDEG